MISKIMPGLRLLTLVLVMAGFEVNPLHAEEQCLADAWKAYNQADYAGAIKAADRCIDEFGKAAAREQEKLDAAHTPPPPTGAVSTNLKSEIFARGLLNDVGTAYFVKGRSAEFLLQKGGPQAATYKSMATRAYQDACRLRYARTSDPKGWFWSPCEAATDRLPLR